MMLTTSPVPRWLPGSLVLSVICEALGELRTNARPLDFSDVKAQVEAELGKPLEELFTTFDEKLLRE